MTAINPTVSIEEIVSTTHLLSCIHSLNSRTQIHYEMDCIILKKMPGQRLKIMVFGERYWKGHKNKSYIRYVNESRVKLK